MSKIKRTYLLGLLLLFWGVFVGLTHRGSLLWIPVYFLAYTVGFLIARGCLSDDSF